MILIIILICTLKAPPDYYHTTSVDIYGLRITRYWSEDNRNIKYVKRHDRYAAKCN